MIFTLWYSSPDSLKDAHTDQKAHDHLEEWFLKRRPPVNLENVNAAVSVLTLTKLRINLSSL